MRILIAAIICILIATPALAGMEHNPSDRGLRGGSVERGGSQRDERGRNAESSGTRGLSFEGKSHGDGRR